MYNRAIFKQVGRKVEPITCDCCGELYWPAEDVCMLLKINDVEQALAELDPDEHTEILHGPDQDANGTAVVTTDGLFSLIQRERLMLRRLVNG